MAVSSMQAISVIGLMDYIDEVINVLGESGVFHPDEVSEFFKSPKNFTRLQTKNIYAEPLTNLKASLNQTKLEFELADTSDYNPGFDELEESAAQISAEVDRLCEQYQLAQSKLDDAKNDLKNVSRFIGLDVSAEKLLKMKYIDARFGRIPKDSIPKLEAYKDNKYVDFAVCSEDKTHCWGVYFAPKECAAEIDRIFDGLFFERYDVVNSSKTPSEKVDILVKEMPGLEMNVRDAKKELDDYIGGNKAQITRVLSKLEELYLFAGIRAKALQYNNSFIIVGWVPSENKKELKHRLKKIKSVEVEFSDARNEMDKHPPVKLKNCFLARPFEMYTEMYGVPEYTEMDPTLFVAITYIIIFGIMFADLGQGLCLSLFGLLIWKLKKMKIGKILFPCGLSSAVFGTLFGSVFGFENLLDPMYRALGFKDKLIDVNSQTGEIILLSILLGVVLLITAMFLNVYSSLKQKNPGRALFNQSGLAGIVFYGSTVFGLAAEIFLNIHVMTLPYVLGLIVLPFILIFFSEPLTDLINGETDWQPESWGGYIVEHLFESIEVLLSYVTNTMSFLRVGAFVLVHAGMMLVVFVLAETAGGFGYCIILVLGNVLVMALEALLVAIQALRLEYYEMFSRFYSGEGKPFEPVKLITD